MTDSKSGSSAENRPYLGDPQTVGKLLQTVARETIQCRIASAQGILTAEDAKSIELKEATAAARALLGRDPKYAVDATWNVPGAIDAFLKKELNLQEKGAEPILVEGLSKFIQEIHERLGLLENPKADPAAEGKIADILEKYKGLLLGLNATPAAAPAATVAAAPVAAPAAPAAPSPKPAPPPAAAASAPPKPSAAPAVKENPVRTEPKQGGGGGLKWAALVVLLLAVGAAGFFMMKKPAKAPEPQVAEVAEKPAAQPAPESPRVISAVAPVLNSSGTIDLIEGSGKTAKTVSLQGGRKVDHLYDYVRADGKVVILVASETGLDFYDLWVVDDSGTGRQVHSHVLDAKLSRDGTKLAYTTADRSLVVEDISGSKLASAPAVNDFTWAPDHGAVFFTRMQENAQGASLNAQELARLNLASKSIEVVVGGLYDHSMPIMPPNGKFIVLVAGKAVGLPSFWKIEKGQTIQLTNVRIDATGARWVPTPFSTAQFSEDGRWLVYDYKDGAIEQIWGLEFDDAGRVKRSIQLTEGLVPRWVGPDKFICLKAVNGVFEARVHSVPDTN